MCWNLPSACIVLGVWLILILSFYDQILENQHIFSFSLGKTHKSIFHQVRPPSPQIFKIWKNYWSSRNQGWHKTTLGRTEKETLSSNGKKKIPTFLALKRWRQKYENDLNKLWRSCKLEVKQLLWSWYFFQFYCFFGLDNLTGQNF